MFSIFKNGVPYGEASIERQGLYFQIRCFCRSPERIILKWAGGERDLGLCVPMDEGYGIQTRIPAKYLGNDNLQFLTLTKENIFPIGEDVPFMQLSYLREGTLIYQQGRPMFQRSISRPMGQWSEPRTSE